MAVEEMGVEGQQPSEGQGQEGTGSDPSEELARLRVALAKANREAMKSRHELETARTTAENDHERALREAREQASAETAAQWRARLARAKAEAAFGAEGARFVNLVDLSALEVDDDGEVTGLDEQVSAIRAEFPEVFDARRRASLSSVDAGDKPGVAGAGDPLLADLKAKLGLR